MKTPFVAILLAMACTCSADTLRISEVQATAGDDAERMTLPSKNGEEVYFVKKRAVLGDADIKEAEAVPSLFSGGGISVALTDEGAKKMKEVTEKMRPGQDRLAIVVDGRLVSAPVVNQVPLGRNFAIEGLKDLDGKGLEALARKMSVNPPQTEGKSPAPTLPSPKIKTISYTEEEYQQRKAMRENMGIFHIESIPTKEELNQTLHKGMSYEEVVKAYGHPRMGPKTPRGENFDLDYEIAPEKRPLNTERNMPPDGFRVFFKGGKVEAWSQSYSTIPREEKVVGREEPTLKATFPKVDLSSGNVDPITYVEGITIPDQMHDLNDRDFSGLLMYVRILASNLQESQDKNPTVNANCDFIKTLANNFPEVAALREKATDGRIQIKALNDILTPYSDGSKPFPTKNHKVKQDGTDHPPPVPNPK